MININGLTFLDHILNNLSKYYFEKIYLMAGYKGKQIKKKYHNKKILFSKIVVKIEKKPMGTAGCLTQLKKEINSDFLLLNGDSFFDLNLNNFIQKSLKCLKGNKIISMALTKNKNYKSNKKLSNLIIGKNNIVKMNKNNNCLMNGGIYLLKKEIFNFLKTNRSLEDEIINKKISQNQVIGFKYENYFIDIGIKRNLFIFREYAKKRKKNQKCIFFDRDGVINKLNGYVSSVKKFNLNSGIGKIFKILNDKKVLVIIITNQSAIARGLITENGLEKIHKYLCNKIKNSDDARIDDIYYCPFLKNAKIKKYDKNSFFRKPNPGMILNAIKRWDLEKFNCAMIGDSYTDEIAAKKAGIKFFYINKKPLFNKVGKIIKKI